MVTGKDAAMTKKERSVAAKRYYYQIQTKTEQMSIAEEVKGHFEKAVEKAEEKMENGDGDISQSSLTKLKLGLSGTLHDITQIRSELQIAKLNLSRLVGRDIVPHAKLEDEKIKVLEFLYKDFDEYLGKLKKSAEAVEMRDGAAGRARGTSGEARAKSGNISEDRLFAMKMAFIKADETRQNLELAGKIRKMTRALLVAEVANYDFGLGKSEELFEALIIYTRVLSGYYDTVFNFNMAVIELSEI
jgi:hypothetical protein